MGITVKKIEITKVVADAIVNAANRRLAEGSGVCGAIFKEAGSEEMTQACREYGQCEEGKAVITPGFHLPAKYVIHAVGPRWMGGSNGEDEILYSAYENSLKLAMENNLHSIGFPLIATGIFGYPKELAWRIAFQACLDFLKNGYEIDILFAVLDYPTQQQGQGILDSMTEEDKCAEPETKQESQEEVPITMKILEEIPEEEPESEEESDFEDYGGEYNEENEETDEEVDIISELPMVIEKNAEEEKSDEQKSGDDIFEGINPAKILGAILQKVKDASSTVSKFYNQDRRDIFLDTLDWMSTDSDLMEAVEKARENTKIYWEDQYPEFEEKIVDMEVTVSKERTYQAAMRLAKEWPGRKIAVMNFANAYHPGGGVKEGAPAQEECLCRTSTLYPALEENPNSKAYYEYHKKRRRRTHNAKASDALIYTEGVVICKTDEDYPKRMLKGQWSTVDVITIAAPDLRKRSNASAMLSGRGSFMSDSELFAYHVKRALHMLTVAAHKKVDVLVLGAFGCGAFENNPEVVARAYRAALEEFPDVFKRIEFAIYCPNVESENYKVFEKTFVG